MGSLVQIQSPRPFFSSLIVAPLGRRDPSPATACGANNRLIVAPRPAGTPAPRRPAARTTAMSVLVLTNDDGVHAPGLAALERALAELGEVYVVAPEREQSACGHALTLHRPLRPHRLGERRFSVNGTPSDCVNLAVLGFLPAPPVLVVSGVNHGTNLGDDVTYSGTVSAAMEGTLLGVPSIAVSL